MIVVPLQAAHLAEAALLFTGLYRRQRAAAPALPAEMEQPAPIAARLEGLAAAGRAVAAVEDGRLAGYLGWFVAGHFRGTERTGAYCPEWGHACAGGDKPAVYRALYRAAAEQWTGAGCQVHAVSVLACDRAAVDAWFWNGFGLTVVDAVRPMRPLDAAPATHLRIRKAGPADAGALAALDAEHCRHYSEPPVLMTPRAADSAAAFAEFVSRPNNAAWLAVDGDQPVGFIRFDGYEADKVAIVQSGSSIYITGAYVRPAWRGQRAAPAMLDAALRDYGARGFTCCSVDFESFNPEAASFWMRCFDPVCYSVVRVPEAAGRG